MVTCSESTPAGAPFERFHIEVGGAVGQGSQSVNDLLAIGAFGQRSKVSVGPIG